MSRPDERTVLITGASSGIGRATALQLAGDGAAVILVARSQQSLAETERECLAAGGKSLVVVADVSDARSVQTAFDEAVAAFWRSDAVVHSAAALAYGRFEDKVATPYLSSYVTAKWGVHGLVRTLQIEARSTPGIAISLVSPGGVDTPLYLQAGTYLGRHGRPPPPVSPPERVARAVVRAIDRPRRETSVGAVNPVTVFGFRFLPGVFDTLVTPLMHLAGLSRDPAPPSRGTCCSPSPRGRRCTGGGDDTGGARLAGAGPDAHRKIRRSPASRTWTADRAHREVLP